MIGRFDMLMFWLSRLLHRPLVIGDVMWEDCTRESNQETREN